MIGALKYKFRSDSELAKYVNQQLQLLFPDSDKVEDFDSILSILPETLDRMSRINARVKSFDPVLFDHYHSLQYATFLYLLGNSLCRHRQENSLSERLFYLNKIFHSIDVHYTVALPEIFFLSHASGTVLGKAKYGENLVVFQNVTVGRVGESRPIIGNNVTLYPNVVISGDAAIGDNSVISAGVTIHGKEVSPNVIVYQNGRNLLLKPRRRNYTNFFFR